MSNSGNNGRNAKLAIVGYLASAVALSVGVALDHAAAAPGFIAIGITSALASGPLAIYFFDKWHSRGG